MSSSTIDLPTSLPCDDGRNGKGECISGLKQRPHAAFTRTVTCVCAYHRLEESEDESTAQQQLVALVQQVLDDGQLGGHLGAADHCSQWAGRVVQVEELQLLLHEQADGRVLHEPRHARRGRVRAMGGAEGVIDVHVAQVRQLSAERLVVRLLSRVEAHVLEQQHRLVGHLRNLLLHVVAHAVLGGNHGHVQQLGQARGHGRHPQAVLDLAIGPAEVAAQNHLRASLKQEPDRGLLPPDNNTKEQEEKQAEEYEMKMRCNALPSNATKCEIPLQTSHRFKPTPKLQLQVPRANCHKSNANANSCIPRCKGTHQSASDARVVRDLARLLVEGHVEVHAHEHAQSREVHARDQRLDGFLRSRGHG